MRYVRGKVSVKSYLNLIDHVLTHGVLRENRTGVDTLSVFGAMWRHDLRTGFPLLTTKRVWWTGVLAELLWFLRGETNTAYLHRHGVHIWDANADKKGDLGPIYGAQWRAWKAATDVDNGELQGLAREINDHALGADDIFGYLESFTSAEKRIDQLQRAVDALRLNPDSRRILVSAWNVGELDKMGLPPCHYAFQLNSRPQNNAPRRLDCLVNMRSADLGLGVPFNIASYAALVHVLCRMTNHEPGDLVFAFGDLHIYENHVSGLREQLQRKPRPLPRLSYMGTRKHKFEEIEDTFFEINDYDPYPTIKLEMAV